MVDNRSRFVDDRREHGLNRPRYTRSVRAFCGSGNLKLLLPRLPLTNRGKIAEVGAKPKMRLEISSHASSFLINANFPGNASEFLMGTAQKSTKFPELYRGDFRTILVHSRKKVLKICKRRVTPGGALRLIAFEHSSQKKGFEIGSACFLFYGEIIRRG